MRRRVEADSLLELPSGAVLLPLGHGVVAEIHAREHAPSRESHAVVTLSQPLVGGSKLVLGSLMQGVSVGFAGAEHTGPLAPRALHFRGCGFCADVTFHGSSLLLGDLSSPPRPST